MENTIPFHPIIERWFEQRVGQPTGVQSTAWPRIAAGDHVLITAPTGSGKTLTAFLWALNQLISGKLPPGHTSVLYVSPLKALNNDIRRNLLTPLSELEAAFEQTGEPFPKIRVLTRSGDTPASERRRMERHPPEILITTPESLNLMLSSNGGRSILRSLNTVILDEIHAVVGNKRGTHLITAVDRLVPLCGEFQRIALSATVRPLETVAEFVGGLRLDGDPRPVSIIRSQATKDYDIRVAYPQESDQQIQTHESVWEPLVAEFSRMIGNNQSTLFFVNSRRLSEKITAKINHLEERPLAYAHHGSLSREIRTEVEQKLKNGDLKAIVATSSLEMGIDIGALDEVALIGSPFAVSAAIQRVGRAGHQVSQVSRGTFFPIHAEDFVQAAVLARAILDQDIEAIRPVNCPLDVLSQVIVSMVGTETWDIDALYAQLRTSYPYRHLSREQFDLALAMLGGRYADTRIRELNARVSIDRIDNTVVARKGALLELYSAGGTIPDRGYFTLRHAQSSSRIGDLDEEFVWEAKVGQVFTLGSQNWRIERITHNDVFAIPANPAAMAAPFWTGEDVNRDFHFSEAIGKFLETANDHLDDADLEDRLCRDYRMDASAARHLIDFLKRQKEQTGQDLPHRHHILAEFVASGPGGVPGSQLVLHTRWGGAVNRPFALALDAAWEERFGSRIEVFAGNDCIVLQLPHEVRPEELLSLVTPSRVESLLRRRLEGSGFFGARFRECAGRALLLSRNSFNRRMPLWMTRLRSQRLMEAVLKYDDFPILLETWRTCLQDEFDLESLQHVLAELETGTIGFSESHTGHPSPMAESMTWNQVNQYMYMRDDPLGDRTSQLRSDLLRDVVFTPGLRPTVTRKMVEEFERKRQRLQPGYAPGEARELIDWVRERMLIPKPEWNVLLEAIMRDHEIDAESLATTIEKKLAGIAPPEAVGPLMTATEDMDRITSALGKNEISTESEPEDPLTAIIGNWLSFYGPVSATFIRDTLGIGQERLTAILEDLAESEQIIAGQLVEDGPDDEICDALNFEILLRMARARAVPAFTPLALSNLSLFLANHQGLTRRQNDIDGLFARIEQLLCYPSPAGLWEGEFFPARLENYSGALIDTAMQEGDLRWLGQGKGRVALCFASDLDLMQLNGAAEPEALPEREVEKLFSHPDARYDFSALLRLSGMSATALADLLWAGVWQGTITNDSFAALRRGIQNKFKTPGIGSNTPGSHRTARRSAGRSSFSRWKGAMPFAGNWLRLPQAEVSDDVLQTEERRKDRARVLLDRHGILFRELLANESDPFRWPEIFKALRLMELSGEILSGYFFENIPGPQFISHPAFRTLQRLSADAIYWINACDPASLCGIGLDELRGTLPRRVSGNHLVYRGNQLMLSSRSHGKSLTINCPADDANIQRYFEPLRHLLHREFQPIRRITIETINGSEAAQSPYADALRTGFEVMIEHKSVILYRKMG